MESQRVSKPDFRAGPMSAVGPTQNELSSFFGDVLSHTGFLFFWGGGEVVVCLFGPLLLCYGFWFYIFMSFICACMCVVCFLYSFFFFIYFLLACLFSRERKGMELGGYEGKEENGKSKSECIIFKFFQ